MENPSIKLEAGFAAQSAKTSMSPKPAIAFDVFGVCQWKSKSHKIVRLRA